MERIDNANMTLTVKCPICEERFIGLVLPQHDCKPVQPLHMAIGPTKPSLIEELKQSLMTLFRFPEGGVSEMKVNALVSVLERLIEEKIKQQSPPVKFIK